MSDVLVPFLYELRRRRLKVGPTELTSLCEVLSKGLHDDSLEGFYYVARALFVHRETELDAFDEAFGSYFRGVEGLAFVVTDKLNDWLSDPAKLKMLSDEERALIEALDVEELRRLFEERLKEQKKRHQGGNRWIGTGGTSPFGAGGFHPSGIRVGPNGGGRSAMGVADARKYRSYRSDVVLDTRQMVVALRKLRSFIREGIDDELDIDATIDATARNAGDIEVVTRPPRRPNVRVILLMDVGGSMDPYVKVVSELFSAAKKATNFRELRSYYFHNAIYGKVFETEHFRDPINVSELISQCDGSKYHLIVVGDGAMHPGELHSTGPWYRGHAAAAEQWTAYRWFSELADHFRSHAWINPDPPKYWNGTVNDLRHLFEMYTLTLDGLTEAITALSKGIHRRR